MLAFKPILLLAGPLLSTLLPTTTASFSPSLNSQGNSFSQNFGCSSSSASSSQKSSCSAKGSFFCEGPGSEVLCSAPSTRSEPSGSECPLDWWMHSTAKCCVPSTEVSTCDCREGYTYDSSSNKCVKNTGSCKSSEWYHKRSSSCCPNKPTAGKCPTGITCPTDWYWCSSTSTCRPNTCESPQPDCSNWDNNKQCCGTGSSPSSKATTGKSSKRDAMAAPAPAPVAGFNMMKKRMPSPEQKAFLDSADLDAMYCPAPMSACTVLTPNSASPEWAYECVDIQTELTSCGGCSSVGEGQDCTAIKGASMVGCHEGACQVLSCLKGYRAINGTACVRA